MERRKKKNHCSQLSNSPSKGYMGIRRLDNPLHQFNSSNFHNQQQILSKIAIRDMKFEETSENATDELKIRTKTKGESDKCKENKG